MLEAAVASLRFASSTLFGRQFSQKSLDRLFRVAVETQREFGTLQADGSRGLAGPAWDDDARAFFQARRFRAQAVRATRGTDYYRSTFARLGIDPARIESEQIGDLPVTPKQALRDDPEAFLVRSSEPSVRATTTGTTGWPTSVYFSRHELRAMATLASLGFLTQGLVTADDLVQISISTRNVLGVRAVADAATGIGAGLHVAGLLRPEHTLRLLAERHRHPSKKPQVSVMSVNPSHLGELVEHGRRLGYGPDDFGLERVLSASEILTEGLQRRAREVFGAVAFVESYAMTEIAPLGADTCDQAHLHFEPSVGLAEVISLEHRGRAGEDEAGTIVATPFAPFRDATVLLRYDTEDVVRSVSEPLSCALGHLPAMSKVLGRRGLSVRHDDGWTFPRDVLEALESVDDVPLPARFGFWSVPGGVAVDVVVRAATRDLRRRIDDALCARRVPVRVLNLVVDRDELRKPFPLRCDVREGGSPTGAFSPGSLDLHRGSGLVSTRKA